MRVEGVVGGETLFFLQGWPDGVALWDEAVARLSGRYRCVRVELPGYVGRVERRWGLDHGEVLAWLVRQIETVKDGGPVVLVVHDWGAYWGWLLQHRHPELVRAVVGLDVAPVMKPSLREVLLLIGYQWWLVGAFVVGGRLGDAMTRAMARLLGAPNPRAARAAMNYPYFHAWRDILTGRAAKLFRGYRPNAPTLFVYGQRKPGHFHTAQWLEQVRATPGGEVVELPIGHWVTLDPTFVDLVDRWLTKVLAPPPPA